MEKARQAVRRLVLQGCGRCVHSSIRKMADRWWCNDALGPSAPAKDMRREAPPLPFALHKQKGRYTRPFAFSGRRLCRRFHRVVVCVPFALCRGFANAGFDARGVNGKFVYGYSLCNHGKFALQTFGIVSLAACLCSRFCICLCRLSSILKRLCNALRLACGRNLRNLIVFATPCSWSEPACQEDKVTKLKAEW